MKIETEEQEHQTSESPVASSTMISICYSHKADREEDRGKRESEREREKKRYREKRQEKGFFEERRTTMIDSSDMDCGLGIIILIVGGYKVQSDSQEEA